jgi:hypothetical protein
MKPYLLAAILILFFDGCVFHSEPKDNQDFYHVSQLAEFAGVYKNKGDPKGSLSHVIWNDTSPNMGPAGHHEDIEFIEVSSIENSLVVKAIQSGCVTYEKTYVQNRDFEIIDGEIVIETILSPLTRGPGDPLVGPVYAKRILGLDKGKQGKLRNSTYAAGLVYLFLPVAVADISDMRFERVADKPQGFKTCEDR